MSKSNAGSPDSEVLKLFSTDNCPFAQRFWIAALEKEDDPKNPKNFEYNEVNFYNYDLPLTKQFLSVHNTVPAGIWKGKPLRESLPMVNWADETFKTGNNLRANDPKVKAAVEKYTSGQFDTASNMFKILINNPSAEDKEKAKTALFAAYAEIGRDVKASGGPFLLGADFTAADIAVYPFVERAKATLPHFAKIDFPTTGEHADFGAWVSAVEARPSVAITRADRLPRSMDTQPWGEQKREKYLQEAFESMTHGVKENVRKQLRFAPPGKHSSDIAAAKADKQQEDAAFARVDSGKGTAADLLRAHVARLYAGADKYIPLLADDVQWDAPYEGSIGRPTSHKGKADVSELVTHRKKALADFRFHTVRISPLNGSDNEAVAQLSGLGRTSDGDFGRLYDQPDIVLFLSSKDGKITKVREFTDPARLAETFNYKVDPAKH